MKEALMDINDLREYVVFSQTMNFTKSAKCLHISQSALSNHIIRMEKEIGNTLVSRDHLNIRFTVAGYEFLETAAKIVNAYDDYLGSYGGKNSTEHRHFVAQSLQHADRATSILLQRIKEFKRLHPAMKVEIRESMVSDIIENMDKHTVDCGYIGVRLHEPEPEPGIVLVPMLEEELAVWIDTSSPFYLSEEFTPRDLENFAIPTWVGLGPNKIGTLYDEIGDDYGIPMKYSPRYCISREDFFLNKIYAGDAVILTAGSEIIHSINIREDKGLRGFNPPIFGRTYLAFREPESNDAVNQFKDFIRDQFEKNPRSTSIILNE
jgi:DNA-binding transcriptional LysR family regulator